MSEDQDFIIITIEDDSEQNVDDDDDDDVVVIEDSEAEVAQDTSTDDISIIQPSFQGHDDSSQLPSQMAYESEDAVVPDYQEVSQMNQPENLKRYSSNSVEMEFFPLYKRGRSSTPIDENMANNLPGTLYEEDPQHQLRELQHYCEGLQELIESTNRQVNELRGIISRMQQCWEKSPVSKCANCSTSLPVERWATYTRTDSSGASLQQEVCLELQKPDHQEDPALPRIVSTHSLQQCVMPENPLPGVAVVSCIFSGGAEGANDDIPPAQPAVPAPVAVLPPGDPSLATSHDRMDYPGILGNGSINSGPSLPCVCIPHNFDIPGVAQANLENNPEIMNCPPAMGNNSDQHSSSPPECFGKVVLIEMPGKAEANVDGNCQTIYYPAILGSITGADPAPASAPIPSNFVIGRVLLIEMPVNVEASLENNPQARNIPAFLGIDGGQDHAAAVIVHPSYEMLNRGETGLEGGAQVVNNPSCLENDIGQAAASSVILPTSVECGSEMRPETVNHPTLMENGSGQDNNSASAFNSPSFGYFGNPARNIRIPHAVMDIARSKPRPELSARYLIRNLFTEDVLVRSNVYGNAGRGMCALNANRINALREFLQDNYSTCDLEETGYDWKLCVTAINSCIRSLRYDLKRSMVKSQQIPAVDSSTESEQRDSDPTDSGP